MRFQIILLVSCFYNQNCISSLWFLPFILSAILNKFGFKTSPGLGSSFMIHIFVSSYMAYCGLDTDIVHICVFTPLAIKLFHICCCFGTLSNSLSRYRNARYILVIKIIPWIPFPSLKLLWNRYNWIYVIFSILMIRSYILATVIRKKKIERVFI